MTITVRLDVRTEREMARLAKSLRTTKSGVVRAAIRALAERSATRERSQSIYDEISDLVGCVEKGPADLSERTGERFRRILTGKHR
jgi:hypothetical protein